MSADPAIPDPDEQMLARLAAMDMAAAEAAHARFMAAAEPDESARAGRTYQKMARSLRQTLMLKARLKQDRERAAQDAAPKPAVPRPPGGEAVARRVRELRAALLRVGWKEHPEVEGFDWVAEAVEETLVRDCLEPDFAAEGLDDHIARLSARLGFAPDKAALWRDLADPPPAAVPRDAPPWRSSA